jgi:hypothetical protein
MNDGEKFFLAHFLFTLTNLFSKVLRRPYFSDIPSFPFSLSPSYYLTSFHTRKGNVTVLLSAIASGFQYSDYISFPLDADWQSLDCP